MTTTQRRGGFRALMAVTLAVALLGVGAATASSAGAHNGGQHITVFEPEAGGFIEYVPLGPGSSPTADTLLEDKPIVYAKTGKPAGSNVTRVQIVRDLAGGDLRFILDCTTQLSRGSLMFYGNGDFSQLADGITFAVIGGTGRYAGATGTLWMKAGQLNGENGVYLTFHLIR